MTGAAEEPSLTEGREITPESSEAFVRTLPLVLVRVALPLLVAIAACQPSAKTPTGPTTGGLLITISGLPSGPASLSVTGPAGYSQLVSSTITLSNLTPGTYTVTAYNVASGTTTYTPNPKTQAVGVTTSSTPLSVNVTYALSTGALTVTVAGLPGGTNASVTVTGPGSYIHGATGSTTLTNLAPGSYTVAAATVQGGATYYDPAPTSQSVSVSASVTPSAATVTYALSTGTNLTIDGLYITQATQTYTGTVPLVKDRAGYLRVFVIANRANAFAPVVRVRWYSSGVLTRTDMISAPSASVPTAPNEGMLTSSWNLAVPGTLIQPNLSVVADVDPTNLITEPNEADNSFPVSGTPLALTVQTAATARVTLVPVTMSSSGFTGNVNAGNQDSYLTFTQKIHPIPGYAITLHPTYVATTTDSLENVNGTGWLDVLNEMVALHSLEGKPDSQHYVGVVHPRYMGGIAGVAYVPGNSVVVWDQSIHDQILAHEIGHNWGRGHAPCGSPASVDPFWPYPPDSRYITGQIGVYGFDVATLTQYAPSGNYDVMSYCQPYWVSDYTYSGVLASRVSSPAIVSAASATPQPALLVWGRMVGGQLVLEPAFEISARAVMPEGHGAYAIEGLDANGAALFTYAFEGQEVADAPVASRGFAFVIPLAGFDVARLASLRLAGPGGEARRASGVATAAMRIGAAPPTGVLSARRTGRGVRVTWNAASYPMALIRDARTGAVLSFARGGSVVLPGASGELVVVLSDGVRSVTTAVSAQ